MSLKLKGNVFPLKRPAGIMALIALCVIAANFIFTVKVINGQDSDISAFEEIENWLRAAKKEKQMSAAFGAGRPERVRQEIEAFKGRLSGQKDLTRVVERLVKAARKNGLSITNADYSPGMVREAEAYRYTISFPVEGMYPQIKKFINDIETLNYPIVIEEITLSGSKVQQGAIGLRLKISTYFR